MRNFSVEIDIEAERERKQNWETLLKSWRTNDEASFTDNQRQWYESKSSDYFLRIVKM